MKHTKRRYWGRRERWLTEPLLLSLTIRAPGLLAILGDLPSFSNMFYIPQPAAMPSSLTTIRSSESREKLENNMIGGRRVGFL